MWVLCMAFPALKVIVALSVKVVVCTTSGVITVDSCDEGASLWSGDGGSSFVGLLTVAKEVASLPGCPYGADITSGLETCLIGEATGTDDDPGVVPVKL